MAEQFEKWLDEIIETDKRVRALEHQTIGDIEFRYLSNAYIKKEIHLWHDSFDAIADALHKVITIEEKPRINCLEVSFKYKGYKVFKLIDKAVEDGNIQD